MDDPASSFLLFLQNTESFASITLSEAIVDIFIIFIIVALNAFFVASEFALVSVRRTRIQKVADEGTSGGAKAVLRLLDHPTRFISAVQLGVTLASLALGWRGEPAVAQMLWPVAEAVAGESSAAYFAHGVAIVVALNLGAEPVSISSSSIGFDRIVLLSTALDRHGERIEGALDLRANEGVILGPPAHAG